MNRDVVVYLTGLSAVLITALAAAGCGSSTEEAPPIVTPQVTIANRDAAVGSPIQMTYRFVVSPGADVPADYRVFVHFVDGDRQILWTDDHQPPVPTRDWAPGMPIEYTRELFVPRLPYVGEARVEIGLFSPTTGDRVPMAGQDKTQRSYQVATLTLRLPSDTLAVTFTDGWHRAEASAESAGAAWQWSRKEGTLAFPNPKRDVTLFVDLDQPVAAVGAQQVEVRLGSIVVDAFTLQPGVRQLRKVRIAADAFGAGDAVQMSVVVDKTFVPSVMPELKSTDIRELGVRVHWFFLQPQ